MENSRERKKGKNKLLLELYYTIINEAFKGHNKGHNKGVSNGEKPQEQGDH